MRIRVVTISLIFLLSTINSMVAMNIEDNGGYKPLPEYSFVYISEDENATLPDVSDSLFNANAQGIRFAVNRTELRADEPFIATFINHILPLLRDKKLVLRRIMVRGAASPEGPYANNCRLGKERTQRLIEYIGSKLDNDFDPRNIQSSNICEDYDYLIHLMTLASDPETNNVKKIWQETKGNEQQCKLRLQRLNGGKTWLRLKQKYFPSLRQARVMIWFGRKPMPITTEPIIQQDTITTDTLITEYLTATPADTIALTPTEIPITTTKSPRIPLIAVRTNLVHDFFYMPNFGFAPGGNIQLEYFPRKGHLTYNIGFTFSNHRHWQDYKFFQIRDLQLEMRRYFRSIPIVEPSSECMPTDLPMASDSTLTADGKAKAEEQAFRVATR